MQAFFLKRLGLRRGYVTGRYAVGTDSYGLAKVERSLKAGAAAEGNRFE